MIFILVTMLFSSCCFASAINRTSNVVCTYIYTCMLGHCLFFQRNFISLRQVFSLSRFVKQKFNFLILRSAVYLVFHFRLSRSLPIFHLAKYILPLFLYCLMCVRIGVEKKTLSKLIIFFASIKLYFQSSKCIKNAYVRFCMNILHEHKSLNVNRTIIFGYFGEQLFCCLRFFLFVFVKCLCKCVMFFFVCIYNVNCMLYILLRILPNFKWLSATLSKLFCLWQRNALFFYLFCLHVFSFAFLFIFWISCLFSNKFASIKLVYMYVSFEILNDKYGLETRWKRLHLR